MRTALLAPLVLVPLVLVPLTGCIIIDADDIRLPEAPDLEFQGEYEEEWRETRGRNGRVRGDIGPVRNFEGQSDEVDAYADEGWTSVTIETYDGAGRMGMLIIELERDVRDVPSGTYAFASDGSSELGYVYVTGCSSSFDSDYDAPANGGVIVVDNDSDDCDVAVDADMPSENGVTATASGSFTLETGT
jgi:hypothetical protein